MARHSNPFIQLCKETNRIKETYYGTVYRATFTLNGEKADWDIFYIGIPFDPQKEAELLRRFGMEREELPAFYGSFEKAVVRHINTAKALKDLGIPAIQKSMVEYRSVQYFPRMNKEGKQVGQDFYFITYPMESFVGTDIVKPEGACLLDINNLMIRLLQTAKSCNENGFSLGAVDMDSCFYASEEGGRKLLKLAYGFYSESDEIHPEDYTDDVRPYIDEEIADGGQQSLDSDVRMICAQIWTMMDGKHYTDPAKNAWMARKFYADQPESFPTDLKPRYAPPEIAALLIQGMTKGAEAMRLLQTEIRQFNKRINGGEFENLFIPFAEPVYLTKPLPELREDAPEKSTKETAVEERNRSEDCKKGKRRIRWGGLAVGLLSVLLLLLGASYYLLGADRAAAILRPRKYNRSSAQNIYVTDGRAVSNKLAVYDSLMLDEAGNIVSVSAPEEVLFPAEFVSEYIFVDDVKLSIVDKRFSRNSTLSLEEPVFRDNVIDLRRVPGLLYDHNTAADNRITKSVIDKYRVDETSIVLIRDDAEKESSFAIAMLVDVVDSPVETERAANDSGSEDWGDTAGRAYAENTASGEFAIPMEESCPVREIKNYKTDNLYKLRGEWRYEVEIAIEPVNATNGRITLSSDDPEYMYFMVKQEDGKESKTRAVKLRANGKEPVKVTVICTIEGKFPIRISSDDGALNKRVQIAFERPDTYPEIQEPVRPTSTPAPVSTPSPAPAPISTPTPTPEPTPWQYPSGYDGGDQSWEYISEPIATPFMPAPTPQQPVYTPEPTHVYTPEPELPLTCRVSHIDLAVGQSYRLGDYLDGIEYGYVMAIPSPGGIISINQTEGFLLTALAAGDCVITISKDNESVAVSVTVIG